MEKIEKNDFNLDKDEFDLDRAIPTEMKMVRHYYSHDMTLLYDAINPNLSKSLFCNSPNSYSFPWLANFVCPDLFQQPPKIPTMSSRLSTTPVLQTNPLSVIPTDPIEYEKWVAENFVKTGKAQAPRGSTNPNNIGAFASYPHLNTACPMTPKSRLVKNLRQRWPDAIGIGFPKCGTSATSFIDCHSKFVYRDGEGYFWTNPKKVEQGLVEYPIPEAADDEILIEKTPDYSLGGYQTLRHRAELIKKNVPKAKLIVYLCDPALRAFSHIKMQSRRDPKRFDKIWVHNDELSSIKLLGEFLNPDKPIGSHPVKTPAMDTIIAYGEFFKQLKPYMEGFNLTDMAFVDGGGIVENPGKEFENLESFFGVENELKFEFNEEKGYPCLKRPIEMCLGADKGENLQGP